MVVSLTLEVSGRCHIERQITVVHRSGPLDQIVMRLVDTYGAVYHVVAVFVFSKRPIAIDIDERPSV